MTKQMLIGILVCTAVLFGAVQAHGDDMGAGRWWKQPDFAWDLNLTKKEKKALDDLFAKNRSALIDLKGSLEKDRLTLEDILEKDTLDEPAAAAQYTRIVEKRNKLAEERFKYLLGVRKILGAERFRTLKGKFEEMRNKRPWRSEGSPNK